MDEIKGGEIRHHLLNLLKKGLSWGTVRLVRDVISRPFNQTWKEKLTGGNPLFLIFTRINAPGKTMRENDPQDPEEVNLLFNICAQYYPQQYVFFFTAFRTGLRLGELPAFKWEEVDCQGKFSRVRRSYKRGKLAATRKGRQRWVDMSEQLITVLRDYSPARKKEALEAGTGPGGGVHVSPERQPGGAELDAFPFQRPSGKSRAATHPRARTVAHLCQSAANRRGRSGVSGGRNGHRSLPIILDLYGPLVPGGDREMVNRLDTPLAATYPQAVNIKEA
jgi:integrase